MSQIEPTSSALCVAPRSAPKRFTSMLSLYTFPTLEEKWLGIWETIGVENIPDHPKWTLILRIAWVGCRPLGTVEKLPEMVIDLLGHKIDRAALRGLPNIRHEPRPTE